MTSDRAVLVVDDDPFIRELILTTLEGVSDFELHQAEDGLQALEVAERERPRLVFMDIDMPRLDGVSACRRLREAGSDAMVVMLTAASEDMRAPAEAAGADFFLSKPFSPLQLLRLVDRVLGEE